MKSIMKPSTIKTLFSNSAARRLKFGALGSLLGLAMLAPTTALGWNYSNVPLFWTQTIKPNVALMLDNSGSMNAIAVNESFQRASQAGTLSTQEWYWCNGSYNNGTKRCDSKNTTAIRGFTVQDWNPSASNTNFSVGRNWYTTYASSSSCTSGNNGFYKNAAGNATGTVYSALGICLGNHGIPNGARIDFLSPSSGGSFSPAGPFWVVNRANHGFQLAATPGGAPVTLNVKVGTNGSFGFRGYRVTLPTYTEGVGTTSMALCNVTRAPTDAKLYAGVSGNTVWIDSNTAPTATNIPTRETVGVLVSNNSTNNGGTRDSCVRWKMANTKRYSGDAIYGYDYTRWDDGTLYWTPTSGDDDNDKTNSNTVLYPRHLLNTLLPPTGNASVNFSNNAIYPDTDSNLEVFTPATDNMVIPRTSRIEAAREAAQKVVLDFNEKLNIGLFRLSTNYASALYSAVPNGSSPATVKTALIGANESMLPADMPLHALDGLVGNFANTQSSGTPLSGTQLNINTYFSGGSSPIRFRCQKNYAVVMTDGDPTSDDGGTLDARTQTGYDTDAKTGGLDVDGVTFGNESGKRPDQVTAEWTHQNIIPYTIGLGLENNLLKRAPLVDRRSVTKSEIAGNVIKLPNHGLETGDYVEVVSNAATGLTNGRFYYAVVLDADSFKLASGAASGQDSSASTNWKQKAFDCAATGTTSATGPCLPVSNGGTGATMVMSIGPGKAFFSFTPDQLAQDMSSVFNKINNLTASASAVSTNTKQFGGVGTALVYQARFNTEDWGGEVAAYQLNKDANGKVTVDTSPTAIPYWSTKTTLATAAQRTLNLFTWKPSNSTGQPLLWGNLDPAQQTSLIDATTGTNVINWLKGANVAGMRAHSAKFGLMGDVLNSDPAFFSYQNFGYTKLPTSGPNSGASTYQQYVDDGKNNRTPMIFVGANDGMLHAFNANTGAETMAFVPSAVFSDFDDANNNGLDDQPATRENKLLSLTDVNYDHRYFVDGNTAVWDAFDGSNWHSFLVGALGKGGRSVFAIDVTDTAYTASDIKWEFTHQQLGYTYGQPMVARLANNKWYAIFPNGLDSQNDQARVFMVNIHNAADFVVLQTNEGSPAVPNGMMSVQVKVNAQRTVTDIYAGDMRGNIWKFDMYDEGAGAAQFPGVGTKLFTAGDGTTGTPQAITGGLSVGKHPSGLGSVIFFGTGKYFETQDNAYSGLSVPQVDSFYAVLDNGSATNLTRAQLHQQSFTMLGNNRQSTTDTVAYAGSEKGWFIDLKDGPTKRGERVVSSPVLYGDRVIFVSIVPLAGASCGGEGSSYLNELSALNGGMLSKPVVDTDNDGDIDADDVQVSSLKLNGLSSDASIIQDAEIDYKIIGNTQVNNSISATSEEKPAGGGGGEWGRGRLSWQQLQ